MFNLTSKYIYKMVEKDSVVNVVTMVQEMEYIG